MDTQLVRLDAPYNIICRKDGTFALHIATLIVVKERLAGVPEGVKMSDTLSVGTYPIVKNDHKMDGEVWLDSELDKCLVVARQGGSASLRDLAKVMAFLDKEGHFFHSLMISVPLLFDMNMIFNKVDFHLPSDMGGKKIVDYNVPLVFEEGNNGYTCMVYSSKDSYFYFSDFFATEPPFNNVHSNSDSIKKIKKLRDNYMFVLKQYGLHRITFTTNDKKYQWFVDELNAKKSNG